MRVYVAGAGAVSPQATHDRLFVAQEIVQPVAGILTAQNPAMSEFVPATAARRLSNISRRSILAAYLALAQAGIDKPDRIVAGTEWGCLQDTIKFLESYLQEPLIASPSAFAASTHNSVAAQLAIFLNCHGANITYTSRGHSFEHALDDAIMSLEESTESVLVGGFDEMTAASQLILKRLGLWKPTGTSVLSMKTVSEPSSVLGEGACFFVLTATKPVSVEPSVWLSGLKLFYGEQAIEAASSILEKLLEAVPGFDPSRWLLLHGMKESHIQPENSTANFCGIQHRFNYKLWCGDYPTASGFGVWLGNYLLKNQTGPLALQSEIQLPPELDGVVVYTSFWGTYHSFILLQK